MAHCTTEFFKRYFFASYGLHNIGPSDEHVTALAHHEDEVSHRRGVHGSAGTWSKNDRDLRNHTARLHVAIEDAAVTCEGHHTFLNSCAGTIVEANDRSTNAQCHIHQLVNLLGKHFAKCSTEHGEVLRKDKNLTTLNGAPTSDDTVGVRVLVETSSVSAVTSQHVELLE